MLRRIGFALILILLALHPPLHGQSSNSALSSAEVEQLRDSAYFPGERVLIFVKFLDDRSNAIHELFARARRPGREQDAHELLEQFTSIADELEDNLSDYSTRHSDIRRPLPRLTEATDRWASMLKSAPDNEAYSVSRKLALEAIRDLREETTELIQGQRSWFAAHPPAKEEKDGPIDITR